MLYNHQVKSNTYIASKVWDCMHKIHFNWILMQISSKSSQNERVTLSTTSCDYHGKCISWQQQLHRGVPHNTKQSSGDQESLQHPRILWLLWGTYTACIDRNFCLEKIFAPYSHGWNFILRTLCRMLMIKLSMVIITTWVKMCSAKHSVMLE